MQIIKSIIAWERNPRKLAAFSDGRCKKSEEEIAKVLEGSYLKEYIFALKQALEAHEFFSSANFRL